MKQILFSLMFLASFVVVSQTNTWNGMGSTNNWSDSVNWSLGTVPATSDDVVFDATSSKNCVIDQDVDINSLNISGYSGIVDGNTIQKLINVASGFTLASGTFISTDGQMQLSGSFTHSGGTFSHNNGTFTFYVSNGGTLASTGTTAYNILEIAVPLPVSGGTQRNFNFGTATTAATLLLNGSTRTFGYQGTVNVTSQLQINGTSTSIPGSNTGTFNFTGAGPISIVGAGATLRNPLGNVVINTTGNVSMSNNINVRNSWVNTNIGSFTSGTSTVYFLGNTTLTSGTTAATRANFDNLLVPSGSTLVISGSSQIDLWRNLSMNGTLTSNTSLIRLVGSSSQAISGTSMTLNALEVGNTGTKTLSAPVNILDSVKISAAGTLASGGNLTLKSTLNLKGRIAQIASGGSITGNVTVETFAKGGSPGWAELGAGGLSGLTFNSWYGQIPMAIEGSTTGVTSAGGYYFESVQGWDETNSNGYDTTITVTSPITVGKGYWVYLASSTSTANNMTWSASGTPVTGNVNITLTKSAQNGDNLIANPYASPISWTKLWNGNGAVNNAIYTYNADGGVYASYVSGVGTNGGTDIIPAGQGFYVSATSGTVLTATESCKTNNNTSANQLLRPSASQATQSNIGQVFKLNINGTNGDFDETAFRFHASATTVYDQQWDAKKIFVTPGYAGYPGNYSQYTTISSKSGNQDYSINSLPPLTQSVTIPVLVKVMSTGSYTISPGSLQDFSNPTCFVLHDKLLNVNHNLNNGPYVCNIADTTSVPRFELIICAQSAPTAIENNANNTTVNPIQISQDMNGAFVKTSFDTPKNATISVYNVVGQKLGKDIHVNGTETTTYIALDLHNQVIMIRVTTDKESVVKKIVLH